MRTPDQRHRQVSTCPCPRSSSPDVVSHEACTAHTARASAETCSYPASHAPASKLSRASAGQSQLQACRGVGRTLGHRVRLSHGHAVEQNASRSDCEAHLSTQHAVPRPQLTLHGSPRYASSKMAVSGLPDALHTTTA